MTNPIEMPEEDVLKVMDLHLIEGRKLSDIAPRFGKSKSALAGLMKRVRDETNKSDPNDCQNNTLPDGWWKR